MPIRYTVRQGDCIHSIAYDHGFFPDAIWEHPDNSDLRQQRNDAHVLMPDDVVSIPDLEAGTDTRGVDQRHRYRRRGVPKYVKVQLNEAGVPIADEPCAVSVEGVTLSLVSDADGWIRIPIRPNATVATVRLESGEEFELRLGELNPADTLIGVQQRLAALGLYKGPVDGEGNDELRAVLERFQAQQGVSVTGEADGATQAALADLVGL